MALEEASKSCLEILDIVAFESSVFVLSDHWDRNAYPPKTLQRLATEGQYGQYYDGYFDYELVANGFYDREIVTTEPLSADPDWLIREVVLYEFHRDGRYIEKIVLPLVRLTSEGYSKVQVRLPGKPIVRSQFIHFHERFFVRGYSRCVRVDYLFGRDGRRLGVWSNENYFDVMRDAAQPRVPWATTLKPEWATADTLIALQPNDSLLLREDKYSLKYPYGESSPFTKSHSQHLVSFRHFSDMAVAVNHPNLIPRTDIDGGDLGTFAYIPKSAAHLRTVEMPFASRFVESKVFVCGWHASTSDPGGVWVMGTGDLPSDQRLVRLEVFQGEPTTSIFRLPHPFDLFRDGILEALKSVGHGREVQWVPTQDDYSAAEHQYMLSVPGVLSEARYQLENTWGNYLLISLRVRWGIRFLMNQERSLVLFERQNDRLKPVRVLDPRWMQIEAILDSVDLTTSQRNQAVSRLLRAAPVRDCAFSEDYLFSISKREDGNSTIVAANVESGEVTEFLTRVPR